MRIIDADEILKSVLESAPDKNGKIEVEVVKDIIEKQPSLKFYNAKEQLPPYSGSYLCHIIDDDGGEDIASVIFHNGKFGMGGFTVDWWLPLLWPDKDGTVTAFVYEKEYTNILKNTKKKTKQSKKKSTKAEESKEQKDVVKRCDTCMFYKYHPNFEANMCFNTHCDDMFCDFPKPDYLCTGDHWKSKEFSPIPHQKEIPYVESDLKQFDKKKESK